MGNVWSSPAALPSLKYVLKQSSQLKVGFKRNLADPDFYFSIQRLQIPIEAIGICDFVIPTLRQLSLFLQSGTTSNLIKQWNGFLENHPLLEDLWCNPSSTMVLPRNGLTKLKRLSIERNFLDSFQDSEKVPESIECLQYTSFRFNTGVVPPSRCNFEKLKKLYLLTVKAEDELYAIAASCPALTWLHIHECVKFELVSEFVSLDNHI